MLCFHKNMKEINRLRDWQIDRRKFRMIKRSTDWLNMKEINRLRRLLLQFAWFKPQEKHDWGGGGNGRTARRKNPTIQPDETPWAQRLLCPNLSIGASPLQPESTASVYGFFRILSPALRSLLLVRAKEVMGSIPSMRSTNKRSPSLRRKIFR